MPRPEIIHNSYHDIYNAILVLNRSSSNRDKIKHQRKDVYYYTIEEAPR